MRELSPASNVPCDDLGIPDNSDPQFPYRLGAGCTKDEGDQLKEKIAVLLNSPFLDRFPGFKECIKTEFSNLNICCHTTFSDKDGPWPNDYNVNFSFPGDLDSQTDWALDDTIKFARDNKILKLGTWFFRPENGFLSNWFLVRLFGALCPLGIERNDFSWFDAAMLLEPYPEYIICDLLSRIGRDRIQEMHKKCIYGESDANTRYNFKFFAVDVCTGSVYLQPIPPSPGLPTPARHEDGTPITLGIIGPEDQTRMFERCHIS